MVDQLCDALLATTPAAAIDLVRGIKAEGISRDALCLDYIAEAARRMGERWAEDSASFLDVTLASGRLVTMVRDLAVTFNDPEPAPLPGHRVLISTVPGETHNLGAIIAAECFRRNRWQVDLLDGANPSEIKAALNACTYPVLGLSAGSRRMLPVLTETVRLAHMISPKTIVCVGGPILEIEPDVISLVDADHSAEDPAFLSVLLQRQLSDMNFGTGSSYVDA